MSSDGQPEEAAAAISALFRCSGGETDGESCLDERKRNALIGKTVAGKQPDGDGEYADDDTFVTARETSVFENKEGSNTAASIGGMRASSKTSDDDETFATAREMTVFENKEVQNRAGRVGGMQVLSKDYISEIVGSVDGESNKRGRSCFGRRSSSRGRGIGSGKDKDKASDSFKRKAKKSSPRDFSDGCMKSGNGDKYNDDDMRRIDEYEPELVNEEYSSPGRSFASGSGTGRSKANSPKHSCGSSIASSNGVTFKAVTKNLFPANIATAFNNDIQPKYSTANIAPENKESGPLRKILATTKEVNSLEEKDVPNEVTVKGAVVHCGNKMVVENAQVGTHGSNEYNKFTSISLSSAYVKSAQPKTQHRGPTRIKSTKKLKITKKNIVDTATTAAGGSSIEGKKPSGAGGTTAADGIVAANATQHAVSASGEEATTDDEAMCVRDIRCCYNLRKRPYDAVANSKVHQDEAEAEPETHPSDDASIYSENSSVSYDLSCDRLAHQDCDKRMCVKVYHANVPLGCQEVLGPGWTERYVKESNGLTRKMYTSPKSKKNIRGYKEAIEFQRHCEKNAGDEEYAYKECLKERRLRGAPGKTPGPGWTPLKEPYYDGSPRTRWISPERKIVFKYPRAAHEFAEICRKEPFYGDEYQAWDAYVSYQESMGKQISSCVLGVRQVKLHVAEYNKKEGHVEGNVEAETSSENDDITGNDFAPGGTKARRENVCTNIVAVECNKKEGHLEGNVEAETSLENDDITGNDFTPGRTRARRENVCTDIVVVECSKKDGHPEGNVEAESGSENDDITGNDFTPGRTRARRENVCTDIVVVECSKKDGHLEGNIEAETSSENDDIPGNDFTPGRTRARRENVCTDIVVVECNKKESHLGGNTELEVCCSESTQSLMTSSMFHDHPFSECEEFESSTETIESFLSTSDDESEEEPMSLSNRQWKTKHALTHRENELLNVGSNQRIKCTGKKATSVNSARFMHKRKSNDDTCYVCPEIGGTLIGCNFCEKSFHLECNVPRLHQVPGNRWKCCECVAVTMKRKQRCGECYVCIRPDCGQCTPCLGKKAFGGSGSYGKSCKHKQCPHKRYAKPEQMPTKLIKSGMKAKQNGAPIPRKRIMKVKHEPPGGGAQQIISKRKKNNSSECRNTGNTSPPGPGWEFIVVHNGTKNIKYWLSPCLKLKFKNHKEAVHFVSMVHECHGDENLAWKKYAQDVKASGRQMSHFVLMGALQLGGKPNRLRNNNVPTNAKKRAAGTSKSNKSAGQQTSKAPSAFNCDYVVQSPFLSNMPAGYDRNSAHYKSVRVKPKLSMFEEIFPGRVWEITGDLSLTPPETKLTKDGIHYELASAKVPRKKSGGFIGGETKSEINLVYIATHGLGIKKINLQQKLGELCSFSSLESPCKVIARLTMLQASVQQIQVIKSKHIKRIQEIGHEGCGFYPEGFFDDWGLKKGYDSVQVRILAPKIGLMKGMLTKKRGITQIQIPDSMLKVPPVASSDADYAIIVIKKASPSINNSLIGRFIDPDEDAPKGFKTEDKKPLGKMSCRMLAGFGVPEKEVEKYKKRSRKAVGLKHTYLKGLTDPTGKIPEGKCFITGYTESSDKQRVLFGKCHKQVYVSRSPSVDPADAKILSVVGSKPKEMSVDEWDELCSYKFGSIIFGNPVKYAPLPCMIADGDLDGDDFFICWDDYIVDHLLKSRDSLTTKARKDLFNLKIPRSACNAHKIGTKRPVEEDPQWLSKAQAEMLDFSAQSAQGRIVGKLYTECFEASKKNSKGFDIYDEDACAFAKAYKNALEMQKHGGKIFLPEHLHEKIPKSMRCSVSST